MKRRAPQTIHDFDLALADAMATVQALTGQLQAAVAKVKAINADRNRLVGNLLAEAVAQIKKGGRL
jgi:hypothetical protein